MRLNILSAAMFGVAAASSVEERGVGGCRQFNIPVTAHATNKLIFSPTHNLNTVAGVTSFLSSSAGVFGQLFGKTNQGGTFQMSARYCPPSPHASAPAERANHVQLLLHGIPYNKNYWLGYGREKYSWETRMTAQGYPVLSFDNLGNGNSTDHPDPILTVQQPLEIEIVHQIVKKMRAGTIGHGVPKAKKVIFGSHSYASALSNGVLTRHPKDFDAALMTGYSLSLTQALPGAVLAQLEPASLYNPKKYGHLAPGYITFGNKLGKRETYYAANGDFNPAIEDFDFYHEGITSVGEITTFFTGFQQAPDFTRDILIVTGEEDALFCGVGSRLLLPKPNCGKGNTSLPAMTCQQFFPNANCHYYMPPGTSHATNLHYSSQSIFKHVSEFLDRTGY